MARAPGSKFNPKVIEEKCAKAGISFWLATEIALELQKKDLGGVNEEELNDAILNELEKKDAEAAREFENYHKIYVRTSDGVMDSFNKQQIIESMIVETPLQKSVCEEIAQEVESDIRRLELKYISAPLIREMVNSKLLERRYLQAKNDYSRLGLPIYDVTQIIEKQNGNQKNPEAIHRFFGDSVAEEYVLIKVLPEEVSKAHLTGLIHIHNLPYFATKPTSLQNDLRWFLKKGVIGQNTNTAGPAKHADVAVSHALRVLISGETHLSGGQSIDFFNLFLAPYTMNLDDKKIEHIMQSFLYELNQIYALKGGRLADSTINFELEVPEFLKKEKAILPGGKISQDTYGDYERESIRLLNLFLKTMSEGDQNKVKFRIPNVVIKTRDASIPLTTEEVLPKFLEKNPLTVLNIQDSSNKNIISPNQVLSNKKWFNTLRTGVLQEVSVNLPQIALSSKEEIDFFNAVDSALENSRQAVEIKRKLMEKRLHKDKILPFLTQEFDNQEYYSLDNAPSIINLIGLDNAVREFTGDEINKEKEAFFFAEKVLNYVKQKIENYNKETPGMSLGLLEAKAAKKRFAKMNEKKFGIKEVYPNKGFTHSISDKAHWLETEKAFQEKCVSGHHLVIKNYEEPMDEIYSLIKKEFSYFTLIPKTKAI